MSNKTAKSTKRFQRTNEESMGSLLAYVNAGYAELVDVFGKPNSKGDGYKVSTEWVLVDTKTGQVFRIYDYKDTALYDKTQPSVAKFRRQASFDWHIGGEKRLDMRALQEFLSAEIERPVNVRNWLF